MQGSYEQVCAAAATVRDRLGLADEPAVGVVLGSGLGAFGDTLDRTRALPYAAIPHFPQGSVAGHQSRLIAGQVAGNSVLVMQGRVHLYEGYPPQQVVLPVRTLAALGARAVIITNAAGGLRDDLTPGDLMLIEDHLNLTGHNPLVGANDERFGTRFPDMSNAYARDLRSAATQVGHRLGQQLRSGTYAGLLGPSYETPAEIQMLKLMGASAVGMSTVLEVIACAHAGIPVLGISCITNLAAGIGKEPLSHDEVKQTADRVTQPFIDLLRGVVPAIAQP